MSTSTRRGSAEPMKLPRASVPKNPSAASLASDYLRTLLLDGVLKPGDRIPVDEVAEALSLSRQPVREAIIGLENDGLVRTSPRSGTYVERFDEEVIREHHDLHGLLEAHAVQQFVRKRDVESLARLRAAAQAAKRAADTAALEEASAEFRRVIASTSSPRLRALLRSMTRFIPPRYFYDAVPGAKTLARRRPAQIVDFVEAGDDRGAAKAVHAKWADAGDLVVAHLRSTGVIEPKVTKARRRAGIR